VVSLIFFCGVYVCNALGHLSLEVESDLIFATVSYALALLVQYKEQKYSRTASFTLTLFWFMSILANSIAIRTLWTNNTPYILISPIYQLAIASVMFVFETTSRQRNHYISIDDCMNVTPEETAGLISILSFSWLTPLMKQGYAKDLNMDDLWTLRSIDKASTNDDLFQLKWQQETKRHDPSLARALRRACGLMFGSAAIFKLMQDVLAFTQPQFLRAILVFAAGWSVNDPVNPPQPIVNGVLLAFGMLTAAIMQTVCLHQVD
jgi:ATP-binding cassette, subfamily C (CFTR/MRP), member 1